MNSVKYIAYFILFIISTQALSAFAAGERYRVEVLVLQHLNHTEAAQETAILEDYSEATDFLAPPAPEPEQDCDPMPEDEPIAAQDEEDLAELESGESEEVLPDPNALVHVSEMGAEMQDAWRRLRLSGPFRPLQYLSWEQGSQAPFPALRIHDEAVVLTDDPFADMRDGETGFETTYGDTVGTTSSPDQAGDCGEQTTLPEPKIYYALDGTTSLVRTRFLHLHLDLQFREAVMPQGGALPAMAPGPFPDTEAATPQPSAFLVHSLKQNRQVRSARMEYFDGPVIGVLAWITTIPVEDAAERQ